MFIVTSTTQLRKEFKDSKDETRYSSSFSLVRELSSPSLSAIYQTLLDIEESDVNHAILAGKPATPHFRRCKTELQDVPRAWVQFDCDLELPGANSLTLSERLAKLAEICPLFEMPLGYVAQLSSKAGLTAYPDRLALRLYVTLSKPLKEAELKALLHPLFWFDKSMAEASRIHLVRKPSLQDTPALRFDESILLKEGPGLDVDAVRQSAFFQQATVKETHRSGVRSSLINDTSLDADSLREAAARGLFEGRRYEEHYNLIASAIWRSGNAKPIINLIESIPEALGNNRSRETLESQEAYCHQRNLEYFCPPVDEDFRNTFNFDCLDLGEADLSGVMEVYKKENFNGVILCKSPHGSGKTSALVKILQKEMHEHFRKPMRTLYISTLRSTIKKTSRDLGIACYIDEGGTIQKHIITESENLGICVMSIDRLENCKPFDLVVIDESEQMMDWSRQQKKTSNWKYLIDLCRKAKTCLLLDADSSILSAYFAFQIASKPVDYLLNRKSYISEQNAYLLQYEHDFLGKLMDFVHEGESIVWVNVDYSDKNDQLSALVNHLNESFGKRVAVGFDADGDVGFLKPSEQPRRFFEDPDTFIPEMIEKGVRIFITSPVVATGWRYKGLPRFDATLSVYGLGIQTAPAIVQQLQRCVGVKEHFLFIGPPAYRIAKGVVEEAYIKEATRTSDLFEPSFYDSVLAKAQQACSQQTSNIRLHFQYLWNEIYGGSLVELSSVYGEEVKKDLEGIKGELRVLQEKEAEEILRDGFQKSCLLRLFSPNAKADTTADIIELIKLRDRFVAHRDRIKLFVTVPFENDEFISWMNINRAEVYDYFGKDVLFLPHRKKFFSLLMDHVLEDNSRQGYAEFFQKRQQFVIRTELLNKNKSIAGFIQENRPWLNEKLGIHKSLVRPEKILKEILKLYLGVSFKYEKSDESDCRTLPQVKKYIIESYVNDGFVFPSKKQSEKISLIEKSILKKIQLEIELSDLEEEFLTVSGKIIRGTFPKVYVKELDAFVRDAIDRSEIAESGEIKEPIWESVL